MTRPDTPHPPSPGAKGDPLDALAEASGINIHRQWTERWPGGFKVNVITRRRRADGLWDQRVRGCDGAQSGDKRQSALDIVLLN